MRVHNATRALLVVAWLCHLATAIGRASAGENYCPKGQIAEKFDVNKVKQDCLPCLASTYNHIDDEGEVRGALNIRQFPYEACYPCPTGTYNWGGRDTGATSIDQCVAWPVFTTGQTIALRSNNGAYLGLASSKPDERKLRARVGFVGTLERFEVVVLDGGLIALKATGLASPRQYVTAFPDGRLEVNTASTPDPWERFKPEYDEQGTFVLRTAHDHLIQVPGGGNNDTPLRTAYLKNKKALTAEEKGPWERMRLIYVDSLVDKQVIALQTRNGPYLGIKSNPHDANTRANMQASARYATEYQRWQVMKTPRGTVKLRSLGFRDAANRFLTARPGNDGGLFVYTSTNPSDEACEWIVEWSGDGRVSLKSKLNNRYLQAVNGGGADANCAGPEAGPWEQFWVESNWFVKRYTVRDV